MENRLLDHFQQYVTLESDEVTAIKKSMEIHRFSKKSHVNITGTSEPTSFFVLNGLVREYAISNDEEFTINIYKEGDWIVNAGQSAALKRSSANETASQLVCLENTFLVAGNNKKAEELFKCFPRLEGVARKIVENSFYKQQRQIHDFRTMSPEQRFETLLERHPDLFQRVSQVILAGYIGIRPESLSRIRRRLLEQKSKTN